MPDVTIEVEVWCGVCGKGICHNSKAELKRETISVTASCPYCEEEIKNLNTRIGELEEELQNV